jgi:hypothetical protein
MFRGCLAVLGILMIVSAQQLPPSPLAGAPVATGWGGGTGQLNIHNIQACQGPFGPERNPLHYYHHEVVWFRFAIHGAKADQEGNIDLDIASELSGPDGASVSKNERHSTGTLQLGPGFREMVGFELPPELKPGEYVLTVAIRDKLSGQATAFQRKLYLKSGEFAVAMPEFYFDSERTVRAPFGGVEGQTLYFQFVVVGIAHSSGRSHVETKYELLDGKTRQVLSKPVASVHDTNNPLLAQAWVRLASQVRLHTPGDFILRILATDRLANKTATLEVPLRVTAP